MHEISLRVTLPDVVLACCLQALPPPLMTRPWLLTCKHKVGWHHIVLQCASLTAYAVSASLGATRHSTSAIAFPTCSASCLLIGCTPRHHACTAACPACSTSCLLMACTPRHHACTAACPTCSASCLLMDCTPWHHACTAACPTCSASMLLMECPAAPQRWQPTCIGGPQWQSVCASASVVAPASCSAQAAPLAVTPSLVLPTQALGLQPCVPQ